MPALPRTQAPLGDGATGSPATCLVVDDHPAILDALSRLLQAAGLRILGLASGAEEALLAVKAERPDVALCDIRLGQETGIELTRTILRLSPSTAILIYTAFPERAFLQEALDAGAKGFVLKDAPLPELIRAIHTVRSGATYVDGSLARYLAGQPSDEAEALTLREREVLRLVADGLRTEEISRRLFLAPATVKAHLAKATNKLGARTRAHAVAAAIRAGVIS
ncbi:MAG: DNA-binding response regulator [Chloroflexota bacterium]